jgi:hypothetical protein
MRFRKRPPATVSSSTVKAHLIGLGSGTLEFIDDTIKFYIEKGRFRKRNELFREIPMANIEGMNRVGNELSVTWNGTTDTFILEETKFAGTIFEKIPEIIREQRGISEDEEVAKQKSNQIGKIVSIAMEIADSLFDILRSLHGWVDWSNIQIFSKRFEESVGALNDEEMGKIELDSKKLLLSIEDRLPEEISREAYDLLSVLHAYFSGLVSENGSFNEIHPNYSDARTAIQAYYLLNDIGLGTIVGDDDEIGEEHDELAITLENLSKATGLKINIEPIKDVITKLGSKKGKESTIEKSRVVFRRQLHDLIA